MATPAGNYPAPSSALSPQARSFTIFGPRLKVAPISLLFIRCQQVEYLSQTVVRDVAGVIDGRMQSAVSEAVQSVLEDRHLHFDMKVRGKH